jgi:hypothetical protein
VGRFTLLKNNCIVLLRTPSPTEIIFLALELILGFTMFITAILAAVTGLKYYSRLGNLKILMALIFAEIVVDLKEIILLIRPRSNSILYKIIASIKNSSINISEIFNMVEYLSISILILQILKTSIHKRFIKITLPFCIIFLCYNVFANSSSFKFGTVSYTITSFITILNLLLYFKEIFIDAENVDSENKSEYILASSLFLFYTITFPTYLMLQYLENNEFKTGNTLLITTYLGYSYLFIQINKAFKCQVKLKKLFL